MSDGLRGTLAQILESAAADARAAKSPQSLLAIRAELLGKKGPIVAAMARMRELSPNERPAYGKTVNELKVQVEALLAEREQALRKRERDQKLRKEWVDVTIPGRREQRGMPHPLRMVEGEIVRCLTLLGFTVADGPLVEHDWYNFEALNIPQDHPARDMQDTFFVSDRVVLRTHTSNVQIRVMKAQRPPVRILAPGMVFRCDDVDATHSPVFHQIEGLWVDESATFADLKGIIQRLFEHLFGKSSRARFRPSYFPFTEPSAEVDVSCFRCGDAGQAACRVCRGSGWVEVMGAGMVHPAVFEAVGYDPEVVQGFAFGAGLERLAMLLYGIDDIRSFYENDSRFSAQFGEA